MKGKFVSFLASMIAALMLAALPVTALAATGALTIEINPIKVLVNGEVFQPKDVNGNDVMVFTYNGTTYAPLRALAEAYGLVVGYDSKNHIATVDKPAAPTTPAEPSTPTVQDSDYASFERVWTVEEKPVTHYGNEKIFTVTYSGPLSMSEFKAWWKSFDKATIMDYAERMMAEVQKTVPGYVVTAYFSYGQYNLGSVRAESGYTGSNFTGATAWIG